MTLDRGLTPTMPLPFTDDEASYLIGMSFKFTLKELMLASQYESIGTTTGREDAYTYLNSFTYKDYFKKVVYPALEKRGISEQQVRASCDLKNRLSGLKKTDGLFLILSKNDFLLKEDQIKWLTENFPGKYSLSLEGGHLGNMWRPEIKKLIKDQLK